MVKLPQNGINTSSPKLFADKTRIGTKLKSMYRLYSKPACVRVCISANKVFQHIFQAIGFSYKK